MVAGLLKIRDDDPQYPALEVGNEILGGGVLNSRLATRIRQKDGLSYGVGSQVHADSLDPVGSFSIFAISAPQNTAKVESDAKEELAKVLARGFHALGGRRREIRNLVRDGPSIAPTMPRLRRIWRNICT